MREIQRLTGVLRESNTVKCIKCGKILYLEWHQGNLDSVERKDVSISIRIIARVNPRICYRRCLRKSHIV